MHCSWRTQWDRQEKKLNLYCLSPWAPSTHVPQHFKLMINLLPFSHCSYSECLYQFIYHALHSNNMAFWYKFTATFYVAFCWIARNLCVFLCAIVFECVWRQWKEVGVEGGHETFLPLHQLCSTKSASSGRRPTLSAQAILWKWSVS